VVAVSFLVLSAVVWQVQKTHTLAVQTNRLARENHAAIERINVLEAETARFRKERARLTTETDRRICVEVEKVKRVIRAVVVPKRSELLKLTYYQRNPQEIERAIQQGQRVAERFAAINCKNLPTAT
jgi:hypothetical protein